MELTDEQEKRFGALYGQLRPVEGVLPARRQALAIMLQETANRVTYLHSALNGAQYEAPAAVTEAQNDLILATAELALLNGALQ